MKIYQIFSFALIPALMSLGIHAHAATNAQQASRLGKDLTPTGAEKAGNKDASIPAWEGGLATRPAGIDPKAAYADPFAAEKPLYTITAANMAQHRAKLSDGQIELLKRYPNYKMEVYPSHRTFALPASEYAKVKEEEGEVSLVDGGSGLLNAKATTVPFPIAENGMEMMWNHMLRYRGGRATRQSSLFPVQSNGSFTPVVRVENFAAASALKNQEPNRLYYYMTGDIAPASMAGSATLLVQPLNQVKEPNLIWIYNPGARRVTRASDVSYDTPAPAADGLATVDNYDGFNGALDRYDWKLTGKKEMIISYNNYRLLGKDVKPKDVALPGHMNQNLIRYELHRVWVVEATLKPGKRHVYAKRVFYIDEDSKQIAHADMFDGRGELWRVHEMHAVQIYDAQVMSEACDVLYDLQARRYLVSALINASKPVKFDVPLELKDFSIDALRRFAN